MLALCMPVDLVDAGASAVAFSCHRALGCPTGLRDLYIDPNTIPRLKATPPCIPLISCLECIHEIPR